MQFIKINNPKMSAREAVEFAKENNNYRGGTYRVSENRQTFYVVTYKGYSNSQGHRYGSSYEKQWKIIFNPELYDNYCKGIFG